MDDLDTLESLLRALAPSTPALDGARLLYTRETGRGRVCVTACLMVRTGPDAVVPGTAVKTAVDATPTGEHDDDGGQLYHALTHDECIAALVHVTKREARAKVVALLRAFGMSEGDASSIEDLLATDGAR